MKMKYVFQWLLQRNCFLQYPSTSLSLPTLFPTVLDNETAERCWKIIMMQRSIWVQMSEASFFTVTPIINLSTINNAVLFVNEAAVGEDIFGILIEQ